MKQINLKADRVGLKIFRFYPEMDEIGKVIRIIGGLVGYHDRVHSDLFWVLNDDRPI